MANETWLHTVAKTGSYNDLANKPRITSETTIDDETIIASAKSVKKLNDTVNTKANSSHTHNYAGSSSAGGAANSAVKLGDGFTATGTPSTTEKTNLVAMINEVFQNASNGKSSIATAITSKGISATSSETFDSLANKIKQIVTGVDTSDATATADKLLTGQTAYVKGSKITGTMANMGAVSSTLNAGGSYTIPAGYHNGSGKITANSLSSQTEATAVVGNILTGQTAWVNGSKITGTMPNRGSSATSLKGLLYNNQLVYRINDGYYGGANYGDGIGKAAINLPYADVANIIGLNASKMLSGYSVLGVAGNIASLGATTYTPKTTNQTIASGKYLSGVQTIKGDANLVASNIIKGKSIFGVAGSATVSSLGGRGYATGTLGSITLPGWVGTSANHSFSKHEIKLNFNPSVFFWIFNNKLYYSTDYGSDNYVTKTTSYMRGIHHTWTDNTLTWENDHSSSWTISGTWIAYE